MKVKGFTDLQVVFITRINSLRWKITPLDVVFVGDFRFFLSIWQRHQLNLADMLRQTKPNPILVWDTPDGTFYDLQIDVYVCTNTHTRSMSWFITIVHTNDSINANMYTYTCTFTHTQIYTYFYIYTYTHTNAHAHAHAHAQEKLESRPTVTRLSLGCLILVWSLI